jgi:hypothetical protein
VFRFFSDETFNKLQVRLVSTCLSLRRCASCAIWCCALRTRWRVAGRVQNGPRWTSHPLVEHSSCVVHLLIRIWSDPDHSTVAGSHTLTLSTMGMRGLTAVGLPRQPGWLLYIKMAIFVLAVIVLALAAWTLSLYNGGYPGGFAGGMDHFIVCCPPCPWLAVATSNANQRLPSRPS